MEKLKNLLKKPLFIVIAVLVLAGIICGIIFLTNGDKEQVPSASSTSNTTINKNDGTNTSSTTTIIEEDTSNTEKKEETDKKDTSTSGQVKKDKYDVTFYNDDKKTILQKTTQVAAGKNATYSGALPKKEETATHTFTFAGWDQELGPINQDTNFIATYTAKEKTKYNVVFYDDDQQTVLLRTVCYDGQMPVYTGSIPEKDDTESTRYEFSGWDKKFSVISSNTSYTAKYNAIEKDKYTATFVDEKGSILQAKKIYEGQTPKFYGTTPTKERDDYATYEFAGWTPNPTRIKADTIYTVKFNQIKEITKDIVIDHSELNEFGYLTYTTNIANKKIEFHTANRLTIPENFIGRDKTYINILPKDAKESDKYEIVRLDGTSYFLTPKDSTTETDALYFNDIIPEEKYTAVGIEDYTFYCDTSLNIINLPHSIKSIGKLAFYGCKYLSRIVYDGTMAEWNAITKGELWNGSTNDFVVQCLDGDIAKEPSMNALVKFEDGNVLNWDELKNPVHGEKYGYNASNISYSKIGDEAFENCDKIVSLEVPDTVTEIGVDAFKNSSIESIVLSDSLKKIDSFAFAECDQLREILIPGSVIEIGINPFIDCANLNTIRVATSNTVYTSLNDGCNVIIDKIKNELVSGCKNSIIPYSTSYNIIGKYAFERCLSGDIVIPSNVKTIDSFAFALCDLENIEIINADRIEAQAFTGNGNSIKTITLPKCLKFIGSDAFYDNYYDNNIVVYYLSTKADWNNVEIHDNSFASFTIKCTDSDVNYVASFNDDKLLSWDSLIDSNNGELYGYIASKLSTTRFYSEVFAGCKTITAVIIPESVEVIEKNAFTEASGLRFVSFAGNKVTSIEENTFANCSSLTFVNLPHSLQELKAYSFSNCTSINIINFNGTKAEWNAITKDAKWNNGMTQPYTIKCTDGDIEVPKKVSLFRSLLNAVGIGSKEEGTATPVDSIENKINESIEETIKEEKANALTQSNSKVNDQLVLDGTSTEEGTSGDVATVNNPDNFSIKDKNKDLIGYTETTSKLVIPSTFVGTGNNGTTKDSTYHVTTIGSSAFKDCENLTEVVIPDGVTKIEHDAFRSCSKLKKITIPNSVSSIGDDAFCNCSNLFDIYFNGTKAEWNSVGKWKNWNSGTVEYVIHCTDGDITK